MKNESIFLYAAGGHAKVVYDSLLVGERSFHEIVVIDDDPQLIGQPFLSTTITSPLEILLGDGFFVHVCIGSNRIRMRTHHKLEASGARFYTVVHPSSIVSEYATIGNGVFIAAKAIVAPDAQVGKGTIVNHGAVVDHDCKVGDFCHIAPNVTLGGGVRVGCLTLVGSGAIVLPGVEIGECSIIGAGAVVRKNVVGGSKVAGNPAKEIE